MEGAPSLRDSVGSCPASHPALKRGANKHFAYGAWALYLRVGAQLLTVIRYPHSMVTACT